MSRGILIVFGVGLVVLGIVTIAYPQRVHDQGSARHRYKDGELTEFGRFQLRGVGLFSILIGVVLVVLSII